MRNITIFLIVACLLTPFVDHRIGFIFLGGLVVIGVLGANKIKLPRGGYGLLLIISPLAIFLSWLYGALLGLINGNEPEFVLSNFFGLAFYPAFYGLLASRVTSRQVVRCILCASMVYFIYGAWLLLESIISGAFLIGIANSISDFRIIYLPGFLYMTPFIAMSIFQFIGASTHKRDHFINSSLPTWFKGNKFLLAMLAVFIFVPMSKGFIAILISLLLLFIFVLLRNFITKPRIQHFILLSIITFVFILLINSEYMELLTNSFSDQEGSNSVRAEQFSYIENELTYIGAGLGAVLNSGYIRSAEAPYGFELSFLNLAHKLGWACIPLFLSYFLPISYGLKLIFSRREYHMLVGAFIIGVMGFVIPGYGNPLLFASNIVLFHCLGLLLVYQYSEEVCTSTHNTNHMIKTV